MRKLLPVALLFLMASCYKKDTNPNELNETDKNFLSAVFRFNKEEIQLGQVALNSSSNDGIRQFARQAINQYTVVQSDLLEVAEAIGYPITDTSTIQFHSIRDLAGNDFDTAYINSRFRSHSGMMSAYQLELNEGNHTYVRHYFLNRNLEGLKDLFYLADSVARTF